MKKSYQWEVTKYGQLLERADIESGAIGIVTTKIYKYQDKYYVELWYNGYCTHFSEQNEAIKTAVDRNNMSEPKVTPNAPKLGDEYWAVWFTGNSALCPAEIWVTTDRWYGSLRNYQNLHFGNYFTTKAEAEAAKYDVYRSITGKEWKE